MENLSDFIDQLIADAQYPNLTPEVKQELINELSERLMEQIDRAAINALSEEQAIELSKKMDDPNFSQEDMTKFMQDSGVNLQQVALETMMTFRSLYLGGKVA